MNFLDYPGYFFFLCKKWDLPFAYKTIINDLRGDKKYGISSTGYDNLRHLEKKGIDISHASSYMPVPYRLLEPILTYLEPLQLKNFLDLGCGKGRALCIAANFGFSNIEGVELSKKLCLEAETNLPRCAIKNDFKWKIYHNDAFYFDIPHHTDCILIFNPFDEFLLSGVIENIEKSLAERPRQLYIIYITPLYKSLFFDLGFDVFASFKPEPYLEAVVLKKNG